MREGGRRDDRRIGDLHMVVQFIALLETSQNSYGVFDTRLLDEHLLETAFESRILLDVLSVLIQSSRADAVQLATSQGWLQHVARVHGTIGLAGPHHGVQLINEEDHIALLLGQFTQHRLEPLFKFTTVFGARHQRTHIEGEHPLVLQPLGNLAIDDALCQPLGNRRLTDPGFTDEHWIILGPTLQDLNGAPYLIIAPDDRIQLAALGPLGQIDGVFFQSLAFLFRLGIIHLVAATHLLDGLLQLLFGQTASPQDITQLTSILETCQDEHFRGDELVLPLLGILVAQIQHPPQLGRELYIAVDTADFRQTIQLLGQTIAQCGDIRPGQGQQRTNGAPFLIQQGQHQVQGFDELMIATQCQRLGIGDRDLKLAGETIQTHFALPSSITTRLIELMSRPCYTRWGLLAWIQVGLFNFAPSARSGHSCARFDHHDDKSRNGLDR